MTTPAGELSIKANDRLPVVEAVLGFAGGGVADLSGATGVSFIMRLASDASGQPKVNKPAYVVDPAGGRVRYDWAVGDTDTPGVYNAEWQVTYTDGRKRTFPTLTYHTVVVIDDLDGA